jgi:crotonobetainyl-CoA:carnitine CoA-transferase CaiB-like acyl-CoA transferase
MSEENVSPAAPDENTADAAALQRSVERLEAKNRELIQEKQRAKAEAAEVEELRKFKQDHEQAKLESEGKYAEARQKLQEQFDGVVKEKDQRISELEARVKELEVMTPAVSALADLVHDPQLVISSKLGNRQIERDADGSVVVVDGLQRMPVTDWAQQLPNWMLKAPKPQGSGAPTGKASTASVSGDPDLKYFVPASKGGDFNLTEQGRIFRTNPGRYAQLKEKAQSA